MPGSTACPDPAGRVWCQARAISDLRFTRRVARVDGGLSGGDPGAPWKDAPIGTNDRQWELLLRRYDVERADDRNERNVFAALIGALIAVLALSALFLREGGGLHSWAYAVVPAPPLAMVAAIAYVTQVAIVRMSYVQNLEIQLARAAQTKAPRNWVRGHVLSWWSRGMWAISAGLGVVVIAVVSALALDRVTNTWVKIVASVLYGSILLVESAALLRTWVGRKALVDHARRHAS
jgi:hypothetical protein